LSPAASFGLEVRHFIPILEGHCPEQFDMINDVANVPLTVVFLVPLKCVRGVDLRQLLSYPTLADKTLFLKLVRPKHGSGQKTTIEG